jgi:hypothetical protein
MLQLINLENIWTGVTQKNIKAYEKSAISCAENIVSLDMCISDTLNRNQFLHYYLSDDGRQNIETEEKVIKRKQARFDELSDQYNPINSLNTKNNIELKTEIQARDLWLGYAEERLDELYTIQSEIPYYTNEIKANIQYINQLDTERILHVNKHAKDIATVNAYKNAIRHYTRRGIYETYVRRFVLQMHEDRLIVNGLGIQILLALFNTTDIITLFTPSTGLFDILIRMCDINHQKNLLLEKEPTKLAIWNSDDSGRLLSMFSIYTKQNPGFITVNNPWWPVTA